MQKNIKPITILLFCLVSSLSFGQSKKEVIEILTTKVDSLNGKLEIERSSHTQKIKELSATIVGLEDKISTLNVKLKNSIDSIVRIELHANKVIADLNLKLNKLKRYEQVVVAKNDSLVLLKKELNDLKSLNQPASEKNYIRAKYVSFEVGDLVHFTFKDDKGNEYDFMINRSKDYELSITTKGGDELINPKYKGKTFDIFFKIEKMDLLGWGKIEDVDVIYKLILIE